MHIPLKPSSNQIGVLQERDSLIGGIFVKQPIKLSYNLKLVLRCIKQIRTYDIKFLKSEKEIVTLTQSCAFQRLRGFYNT